MTHGSVLLSLGRATVRYGDFTALSEASLEVRAGDFVAVVGRNASGKTTLLRALAGLCPIEGVLDPMPRPSRVAFVPQRPEVSADFTAREVVALGRHAVGRNDDAVARAIEAVGLSGRAGHAVDRMSGGERQRVAVARALAQLDHGGVLVLDEPFAGIDPGETARLVEALSDRARIGAVVASLHDPGLARSIANRAVVVDRGRIVETGPVDEVMRPERLELAYRHPIEFAQGWLAPRLPGKTPSG